jgi:carboxymethylenebutenolidase
MDQRLIDLYHDYAHVHFDRRVFLEKAAKIVGSASAAAALSAATRAR